MASESPVDPPVRKDSATTISIRHGPKYRFEGHEGDISGFVFLHDNIHIISSSLDGTMRKWNSETGLNVGDPWIGEGVDICAMTLSADGKTIACGRMDGSVQLWDTNGERIDSGNGTGNTKGVESLSWSPIEDYLAIGYGDGTILIQRAESGEIGVGPIDTSQGSVISLIYSPSGDKIASGGSSHTISVWDSKTGKLLVGPIEDLGIRVDCVVWSSDSSKLYSASDHFARVFDSSSGNLLHRFEHDDFLNSVALSPKSDLLACVGLGGTVQLWDTESHRPFGQPLHQEDGKHLDCVLFSQDGKYLAYGGEDKRVTLWSINDIAVGLEPSPPSSPQAHRRRTSRQSEGDEIMGDARDNIYRDGFFQSSEQSRPSAPHGALHRSRLLRIFPAKRLWNALIPFRSLKPASQSTQLQGRSEHNGAGEQSGQQRVPIFPTRRKNLYVHVPRHGRKPNPHAGQSSSGAVQPPSTAIQPSSTAVQLSSAAVQSSSAVVQSSSAAQSHSEPYTPQNPTTQLAGKIDDYGCWDNFWIIVCCIQLRRRQHVSTVAAATL